MIETNSITLLDQFGLRATRPRVAVARLLFGDGVDRHVTAEWVADQLNKAGEAAALATVYNTLHHFAEAGMLHEVHSAERGAIIFDTNTTPHHHFYNEVTRILSDIPSDEVELLGLPKPPLGTKIVGWDVVVRVR